MLGIGFVFALDRFAGIPFGDSWYWGLVLGGAIVFLFDRWDPGGLLVAVVGLVLWYADREDIRVRYVWPLLVMGGGAFLVVRALTRRSRESRGDGPSASPPSGAEK